MKVNFHTFIMGDVDDVDIYAAQPIYEWQQTAHGRWVMENAHNITYHTAQDFSQMALRIVIRGAINDPRRITEYFLRWPNQKP